MNFQLSTKGFSFLISQVVHFAPVSPIRRNSAGSHAPSVFPYVQRPARHLCITFSLRSGRICGEVRRGKERRKKRRKNAAQRQR